jgi:large subunit ribosomal protein L18e
VRKAKTPNPDLIELIRFLKKQGNENKAEIWRDVAEDLSRPSRRRVAVNVSHLNRHTQKNESVVVPGKVLGAGEIDHAIVVSAFAFSEKGKTKIKAAKGKCLSFADLIKKNPKGSNVKIIG